MFLPRPSSFFSTTSSTMTTLKNSASESSPSSPSPATKKPRKLVAMGSSSSSSSSRPFLLLVAATIAMLSIMVLANTPVAEGATLFFGATSNQNPAELRRQREQRERERNSLPADAKLTERDLKHVLQYCKVLQYTETQDSQSKEVCTRLLALLKPYMTKASAATAAAGNSSRRRARRHPRAVGGNPPRVVQVVFDDDANEGGAQEGQGETPFEW